ncbi:hypothetical protein ACFFSW_17875 [Saccharothrix longispora]|uniref:Uncharacterized protein n=1 Tax=Saccharothrix longispora TaxID=33920 RepID=A0ABU1PSE4_9PSEU|nr:hypothetical protein [Saccharothrix longispora]MDR6593554.1 hypothetical protein [Saccharothrix longispora]
MRGGYANRDVTCSPGVFAEQRRLVAADASAHRSRHLGRRLRAVCGALCVPASSGRHTWCSWPLCPQCPLVRRADTIPATTRAVTSG